MAGFVQTVLGSIKPEELGPAHSHEHLVAHATPELVSGDADLALDDPVKVLVDLAAFRSAGGSAIAEMTTVDYGRDAEALKRVSVKSGVRVIAATGFNKGVYCRPFTERAGLETLTREMTRDLLEGIGDTGVRAGMVKFGTSLRVIEPWEEQAARAAARAHLETGAPVVTHTEAGTMAIEQIALLTGLGVRPDAVMLSHMDRNPDMHTHLTLADRGVFLSYDQIPKSKYGTEDSSIELIVELARRGLATQVMIGGDFARRQYFGGWGGQPGLAYLFTVFRKKLARALEMIGLDADAVWRSVTTDNPSRAFAWRVN